MGCQMSQILVRYSRKLIVFSASAFVASIPLHASAQAEQSIGAPNPYSAADPFDPSEVVTHNLKDDIRLRLRLPAPDLPPSIVSTKSAKLVTSTAQTNRAKASQENKSGAEVAEPGLIGKSIQSVMSIFDWSDESTDEIKKTDPMSLSLNSDEPIRINIHVGITKPKDAPPAATEEVSSLETPWARNQDRVRRLFTFDEIKTHN